MLINVNAFFVCIYSGLCICWQPSLTILDRCFRLAQYCICSTHASKVLPSSYPLQQLCVNPKRMVETNWQGLFRRRRSCGAGCRWAWGRCGWTAGRSSPALPRCWASACRSRGTWATRRRSAAGWRWELPHSPSSPPSRTRALDNGAAAAASQYWDRERGDKREVEAASETTSEPTSQTDNGSGLIFWSAQALTQIHSHKLSNSAIISNGCTNRHHCV